ncbi:hypothetical protein GCM10009659_32380 [Leucobacter albus]
MRAGIDQTLAQGFARHSVDLAAKLGAEGSEWVAQAAVIGERRKSWRRGVIADLVEEVLPVDLIPGLRRTVAPTLAVVAARPLPDGATELLLMPHASHTGDPQAAFGAAPRVRAAADGLAAAAGAAGALIEADRRSLGVRDPDCPASRAAAKRLLGWK